MTALLLALAAGCGAPRHHDFPWVAGQMQQRTGQAIRDPTTPEPELPDGVTLEDGLSRDEAVAIALWNNPVFLETLAQLGFSRSALIQAGLLSNPVFSILFPLGPKQLEFTLKFPVEALWLRPKRVAIARIDAEQLAAQLVQSGLDVVRDAKVKWADLRLATTRVELARQSVEVASAIGAHADARLEAGDVSPLEAAAVQADALVAREEALRLAGDAEIAEAQLRSLLGLGSLDVPLRPEEPSPGALHLPLPSPLTDVAFAARPDLRAAELTVAAAGERAGLSRWEVLSLSGIADANGMGSQGFEIGPGLEVGIPIFDWNQGGTARADAEVVRAVRHEAALRGRIVLEVNEAATRYERAREQVELVGTRVVPTLEQVTRRAEAAYAAGETSKLEALAARAQLLRARVREAEAMADLDSSQANLERSVGCRLDAAPPERAASR